MTKQIYHFVFLFFFGFTSYLLNAQAGYFRTGWPSTSPAKVNYYDSLYYSDSTRARVTAQNNLGTGYTRLSLDGSHYHGAFNVGDHVLLIQMATGTSTNTGYWEEVLVSATGTNSIDVNNPTRTFSSNISSFPNNKLQVIRIPYINKLEIANQASYECHAWDGYTGGVLCFVANTLIINDGRISAAAKGHFDVFTLGTGGAGGKGDSTFSNVGGGKSGYYGQFCITPTPTSPNYKDGNIGTPGEGYETYCFGGNGSYTSGTHINWPGCVYDIELNMGNAGGGNTGQIGGIGGTGGGHGGKGGSNFLGTPGNDGVKGQGAGAGGTAGKSGRGGGIILIKVDSISIKCENVDAGVDNTAPFWFNGENGDSGGSGGKGGNGGAGGKGAQGLQVGNDIYYSGGNGGGGKPGYGAQGGDAGQGGQKGALRLYFNKDNACSTLSGNFNAISGMVYFDRVIHHDGYSGKPGKGGKGGSSKTDNSPRGFGLTTPYDTCTFGGPGSGWRDTCNCTVPMIELTKIQVSKYFFNLNPVGADSFVATDFGGGLTGDILGINTIFSRLRYHDSANKIRWNCHIENSLAWQNWINYYLYGFKNGKYGIFSAPAVLTGNRIYFHDLTSTTSNPAMVFDIDSQLLIDYTYSPIVSSKVLYCKVLPSGDPDTFVGLSGNGAQSPPYEMKLRTYGPNSAIWIQKGGVTKKIPNTPLNPTFDATLYFNPNAGAATIIINEATTEQIKLSVYSANGKAIIQEMQPQVHNKEIILPTTGFSNGIYFVILDNGYQKQTLKLVVNTN